MAELSVVHSKLVYDQIRSSNNQLQRTGFTGPCLSEGCSPAAELERYTGLEASAIDIDSGRVRD